MAVSSTGPAAALRPAVPAARRSATAPRSVRWPSPQHPRPPPPRYQASAACNPGTGTRGFQHLPGSHSVYRAHTPAISTPAVTKKAPSLIGRGLSVVGAAYRNRTDDLRITRRIPPVQRRPRSHSSPVRLPPRSTRVPACPWPLLADPLARSNGRCHPSATTASPHRVGRRATRPRSWIEQTSHTRSEVHGLPTISLGMSAGRRSPARHQVSGRTGLP